MELGSFVGIVEMTLRDLLKKVTSPLSRQRKDTIRIMNKYITKANDLVTSRDETRAGFIAFALEKNRKAAPYIEQAKSLKVIASRAKTPKDLITMKEIEAPLLTAAGLSDKALNYFQDQDKTKAIEELVANFLEPAGDGFVDEVVYRYLLIKGDSLGGSMRNIIGSLGQQKLVRSFLSILRIRNIPYRWLSTDKNAQWDDMPEDDTIVEQNVKAISWTNDGQSRILAFNLTIPLVKKNVDICLFEGSYEDYDKGKISKNIEAAILLGELKAGIDPAGADEHWKTANSALERIVNAYTAKGHPVKTAFIGAAIEKAMASEIFDQLNSGKLTNAANLSDEKQLVEISDWIVKL